MPTYLGLLRSDDEPYPATAEEQEAVLQRYIAWGEELTQAGNPVGGGGLSHSQGRVLRGDGLGTTDGPFAESKDVVGGFLTIEAADLDEATKIFATHPHLNYGTIEVRKIGENGCEP